MSDEFAAPSAPGGDPLDLQGLMGSLLVVEPTEDIEHIQTAFTEPGQKTSAVRANVYVIDGPHAGLVRSDALIFPRVMQGQLRGSIGQKVLARLGRGEAKKGQSAPWILDGKVTDADRNAAGDFMRRLSSRQFSQPASSEPPF